MLQTSLNKISSNFNSAVEESSIKSYRWKFEESTQFQRLIPNVLSLVNEWEICLKVKLVIRI